MADSAEGTTDPQITFKVRTSGDVSHTITMLETATVMDLKTKLAGEDFENIPVERQRLIYSGRVLKNDDTLGSYKIKPNNTIHLVKSAASNPTPTAATSTSTPVAVPTNMSAGTANNPLAGLTGARYAGHVSLPSREMFGADGGMGAPPNEDQMAQLLSDPTMLQTVNAALENPDFINHMIQINPYLRNLPNARELLQSPFMRQMMTNPEMLRSAMRMQRNMAGGGAGMPFPAPGATDTTPTGAPSNNSGANANNAAAAGQPPNPFAFPGFPMMPPLGSDFGASGAAGSNPFMALFNPPQAQQPAATGTNTTATPATPTAPGGGDAQRSAAGTPAATTGANQQQSGQIPPNPFASLFGAPMPGANASPFGNLTPEMMQQMIQMLGGAPTQPAAPADNRPPEERYAEQLRQLNEMGFYDFDRNVAALRRSGGDVQGAVDHLLGG